MVFLDVFCKLDTSAMETPSIYEFIVEFKLNLRTQKMKSSIIE